MHCKCFLNQVCAGSRGQCLALFVIVFVYRFTPTCCILLPVHCKRECVLSNLPDNTLTLIVSLSGSEAWLYFTSDYYICSLVCLCLQDDWVRDGVGVMIATTPFLVMLCVSLCVIAEGHVYVITFY